MEAQPEKSNLEVFAQTLLELAQQDKDILVVTSDSRGSGKLVPFGEALPDQLIEVGIAEQNLVGIAAGLASCGKKVFAVSPASFLTARALEHIKNDIAYSDQPVTLVGISAGVSYGALGSTHHSLHDIAALRAIHNIDIVIPGDNAETRAAVRSAVDCPRPLFLRFGKRPLPHLYNGNFSFTIGKANVLSDGNDVAIIATGETVVQALQAARQLNERDVSVRVISMHTLKPLDEEAVRLAARECKVVLTVEEHSMFGGLGEACASVILQAGLVPKFKILAIPDEDTVTGAQPDIFRHYGLTADGLITHILQSLNLT